MSYYAQPQFQKTVPSAAAPSAHSATGTRPLAIASMTERLNSLTTRFDGFHQELDLSRQERRGDDQRRLSAMQTQLTALRDGLELESKNRAASVQALQAWLDDRVCQWAREVEAPLIKRLTDVSSKLEAVTARVETLEQQQVANREMIPKLVDLKGAEILRQIAETKTAVAQEQALRDEREKQVYVKIQDLGRRLHEQIVAERALAERRATEVRRELTAEASARERSHARLQGHITAETAALRETSEREAAERSNADAELANALTVTSHALQRGIKIVALQ
jgi:hypothetical protein